MRANRIWPVLGLSLFTVAGAALARSGWDFEVHGEARARYEDRANRDFSSPSDDDRQDAHLRLRLDLQASAPDQGLSVFLQPQISVTDYDTPTRDATYHRGAVHQLYASYKPAAESRLTLRAGRQEMFFGGQRLIGTSGWDNIGRSFDGARADFTMDRHTVSAFVTQLGDVANRAQAPKLYGVYDTIRWRPNHTVDAYLLHKRDTVQSAHHSATTLGARSDYTGPAGWGYVAEIALQTGDVAGKDLAAYAYSISAGKTLRAVYTPRLYAEYNAASGGNPDDPDDARTFDQNFPSNHDKYGIMDYQGWRNMRNLRLGASGKFPRAVTASVDYHWFWLEDARDFWYGAGGTPNRGAGGAPLRDPTGVAGKTVGQEFDLSASFPLAKDWNASLGYARFMPGPFVKRVQGRDDPSNWWYLQAAYRL